MNVSKIEFKENQFNEKIVFFHGAQIGRYGFKGTHAIDEAMYKAAGKYKSDIIYKRSDSLPYNQYLASISNFKDIKVPKNKRVIRIYWECKLIPIKENNIA